MKTTHQMLTDLLHKNNLEPTEGNRIIVLCSIIDYLKTDMDKLKNTLTTQGQDE